MLQKKRTISIEKLLTKWQSGLDQLNNCFIILQQGKGRCKRTNLFPLSPYALANENFISFEQINYIIDNNCMQKQYLLPTPSIKQSQTTQSTTKSQNNIINTHQAQSQQNNKFGYIKYQNVKPIQSYRHNRHSSDIHNSQISQQIQQVFESKYMLPNPQPLTHINRNKYVIKANKKYYMNNKRNKNNFQFQFGNMSNIRKQNNCKSFHQCSDQIQEIRQIQRQKQKIKQIVAQKDLLKVRLRKLQKQLTTIQHQQKGKSIKNRKIDLFKLHKNKNRRIKTQISQYHDNEELTNNSVVKMSQSRSSNRLKLSDFCYNEQQNQVTQGQPQHKCLCCNNFAIRKQDIKRPKIQYSLTPTDKLKKSRVKTMSVKQ